MKKGCLYWLVLGWWLEPILYLIQRTRIVVWIAAVAVLIGFLMMAGAFLVAMAFIFAVLAVLIIIASMIIGFIQKIHPRRACGTDMEDLHAEECEGQEANEQYRPKPITVCIPQPDMIPEETVNPIAVKGVRHKPEEKPKPTPVRKPEMSDEQALQYGLMCNAYLEHEDDMEQYK